MSVYLCFIIHRLDILIMYKAILVHVETGEEYYKNGDLIFPTQEQKLLWALTGLPNGIEMFGETFETEIDEFIGFTKKEIQNKCDSNFKNGEYNFLPPLGVTQNVELRYTKIK